MLLNLLWTIAEHTKVSWVYTWKTSLFAVHNGVHLHREEQFSLLQKLLGEAVLHPFCWKLD